MDKVSKQELRRLAADAIWGHWFKSGDLRYSDDKTGEVHGLNVEDDRFIAAANPAAILSLLDELEKVDSDRKACWAEFKALRRSADDNERYLREELEQCRKDAERLEWMLAEQCIIRVQNGTGSPSVFSLWWASLHEGQRGWYATERDAIDAAMAKEGGANG